MTTTTRGKRAPTLGAGACPHCTTGYVAVGHAFTESTGLAVEVACVSCGWSQDLDRDGYLVEPPEIRPNTRAARVLSATGETERCGVPITGGTCMQIVRAGRLCYWHDGMPRTLRVLGEAAE